MKPPRIYARGGYFWIRYFESGKKNETRHTTHVPLDIEPSDTQNWWKKSKYRAKLQGLIKDVEFKRSASERGLVFDDRDVPELHEMKEYAKNVLISHYTPYAKRAWERDADKFIAWCERRGLLYADQITKQHAIAYAMYAKEILNGASAIHSLNAPRMMFRAEVEFHDPPRIQRNPFQYLPPAITADVEPSEPYYWPREQIRAFLSAAETEFDYNLFRLQYAGSMRPSEPRKLRWKMILPNRIAFSQSREFKGKTKESGKSIRMNKHLAEALAWFRERSGRCEYVIDASVFARPQNKSDRKATPGPVSKDFVYKRFQAMLSRAKEMFPEFDWEHFTPHKLRGASLSHLAEEGADAKALQRIARHSSYAVTDEKYLHVGTSFVDREAQKLDEIDLSPIKK